MVLSKVKTSGNTTITTNTTATITTGINSSINNINNLAISLTISNSSISITNQSGLVLLHWTALLKMKKKKKKSLSQEHRRLSSPNHPTPRSVAKCPGQSCASTLYSSSSHTLSMYLSTSMQINPLSIYLSFWLPLIGLNPQTAFFSSTLSKRPQY